MTDEASTIDPRLEEWATEREWELLKAAKQHGGFRQAARALELNKDTVRKAFERVTKRAAANGYAPGHWDSGVASGYRMGKVTVQRGPNGVERVWERQHPEEVRLEALIARCEERLEGFQRFSPVEAPPPAKRP